MENDTEFQQPTLGNDPNTGNADAGAKDITVLQPAPAVNNSGKTDELSLALAESRKPVPANLTEPEKPVGKYALDYSLKGEAIHETHSTLRAALGRISALGRLGIVPATSTNV